MAADYLAEKLKASKTESFEIPRGMADKIRLHAEQEIKNIQVKVQLEGVV